MIKLNLLPGEYKKEYSLEKTRRFVVFVAASLYFVSATFILLIFFGYFYLKFETSSVISSIDSAKTTQQIKDVLSLEDDIKLVNKKIDIAEKAKAESVSMSDALKSIASFDNPDSYIKSITIDSDLKRVSIAGFASTRDAVLLIKKAIEESDAVDAESLESPKSNILKEENIDFTFIFNLKK